MQAPMKIHCFPVKLSSKEAVAIVTILALEAIIMTAMHKNYSVEFSGEITEDGRLKGTLKLNNSENKTNLLCHRGGNLIKK